MPRPNSILTCILALGLGAIASAASPYSFKLNESRCRASTPDEVKWLQSSAGDKDKWVPFLAFTRTCPVISPNKRTVLLLITASAERYYKHQPGRQAAAVPLPPARLFLPHGHLCGTLLYAFPDDPPLEMSVRFTDWRDSLPFKLEMEITDPTAAGNRRITLLWDPAANTYQEKTK